MADMDSGTTLNADCKGSAFPSAVALSTLVQDADALQQVRKHDLRSGDWLAVKTANSVYIIRVLENGEYLISGGWFDAHSGTSCRVRINGCTWGGSAIKVDVVAACGLQLEFSNRVRTSPIRTIAFVPGARLN